MNGISGNITSFNPAGVEKPASREGITRVAANPYNPDGKLSQSNKTALQSFASNLPNQTVTQNSRIGTRLNTFA